MLKRLMLALAILFALLLGVVLLGPFLIPTETVQALGSASGAARPESRFLTIPFPGTSGIGIHYLERPGPAATAAPAIVLLHGFTLNAFTWGQVPEDLAKRGRMVAYDQIPYGLSAKLKRGDWNGPHPYAKEAAIAQLFAVLDRLGIERAHLIGNSSGGTLALEAALAHPERVESLILIAPWVYAQRPTFPGPVTELPQMRRLSLLIGRFLGEHTLLGLSYHDPERITPQRRELALIHTRVANWDLAWGELMARSLSTPVDVGERLAQIGQPVLVVTGDQDRLVPVEDTRRVAAGLPNAELVVLPGCGHAPQEECPAAFLDAVNGWLAGLETGPGLTRGDASGDRAPDRDQDLGQGR
jgi:pimeloyl-ACP methyl ester carboxylesterase